MQPINISTLDPEPPSFSIQKTIPRPGLKSVPQISLVKKAANIKRESQKALIRVFQGDKEPDPNFFIDGYDKLIIPFSQLELIYSTMGNPARLKLSPGQAFFIPTTASNIVVSMLCGDEFLIVDICSKLRTSLCDPSDNSMSRMMNRATLLCNTQHLLSFAHTARRLMLSTMPQKDRTIEALGILAVTEALISLKERSKQNVTLTPMKIEKVDSYIHDNIERNLCLQELAELCGLSTHYFARSFKSATGKTPYQYILDRRIALARRLLANTQQSIASIAYDVGFSSQSHMTDLFRKILGTTPGRYRTGLVKA